MELQRLVVATTLATALVLSTLALAAENGGQHQKQSQSVTEYASDAAITTKIKAALVAEKSLSALDIVVETMNGFATLSGTVGSTAQADLAARVTSDVHGVKQVKNLIKVDPNKAH
jgi:hyperosmotically inducible periplasmic protein